VPARLLLVKIAALGDAVMASAIVPAVRARWPDAELTWVAGRSVAPLARLLDGVDRVVEVNDSRLLRGGTAARVMEMTKAWAAIGRGYDVAFVAHTDSRYEALTWFSRAGDVRRPPAGSMGRGGSRGRWHGDSYAALASDTLEWGPRKNSAQYAGIRAELLPAAPALGGGGPVVVISPGGARNVLRDDALRRWPLDQWVALVRSLRDRGVRVVAVGGAEDAAEGAACAEAGAVDLTAQTNVASLLALLQASDCVVSHDSGVMHMALLVGVHVVALFGPTRPEERIPVGAAATVLSKSARFACAPCYDGFSYAKCARNSCVTDVSVIEAAQAVLEILGSKVLVAS
jgi:heptosyltransferase-2